MGGVGLIGSHLCERLTDDGNEVLYVNTFFTGSKDNLLHLLEYPYRKNAPYTSHDTKTRLGANPHFVTRLKKQFRTLKID